MISDKRTGFTLIELMLSMTFLSLLLIAIATVTMHITHLYDKGQTIKSINQSGRGVIDSVRRDSRTAASLEKRFVSPSDGDGLGRLCFGSVSYVWNEASDLSDPTKGVKYLTVSGASGARIILARVQDIGGTYCRDAANTDVFEATSTELLKSDGRDLAMYNVGWELLSPAGSNPQLYKLKFTLGTNEAESVDTSNYSCKPPADVKSNYDFCAVNDFEIVLSVE